MNSKAVQKEALNKLISGGQIRYGNINDTEIAISPDGYRAYVIRKKELFLDLSRLTRLDSLAEIISKAASGVQLILSRDAKVNDIMKKQYRKLSCGSLMYG